MPDIDPNVPVLNISDLEERSRDDLIDMGEEEFGIDGAASYAKNELIFRILEAQAERNGTIFSGGILNIVDDGFGFMRGERLLPGPNDVYVSQSQIRRFGLRSGDYVTGQVRQPKSSEKYYGLLRVDAVNGIDPEEAKRRPDFDSLTPIFPNRMMNLETAPHEVGQRMVDLFAPIGGGAARPHRLAAEGGQDDAPEVDRPRHRAEPPGGAPDGAADR